MMSGTHGLTGGQSAAAVRVLWGAPLLRKWGVALEVLGWSGIFLALLAAIVRVYVSDDGVTAEVWAAVAALCWSAVLSFMLVVFARFLQLVVDYMTAQTEELIDVDAE